MDNYTFFNLSIAKISFKKTKRGFCRSLFFVLLCGLYVDYIHFYLCTLPFPPLFSRFFTSATVVRL